VRRNISSAASLQKLDPRAFQVLLILLTTKSLVVRIAAAGQGPVLDPFRQFGIV